MKILTALAALLLFFGFSAAGEMVLVTGKTAYKGMGVEEVRILAGGDGFKEEFKSTYHGTFRMELPPGEYNLTAVGELPGIRLTGHLALEVDEGVKRIDRVIINLIDGK